MTVLNSTGAVPDTRRIAYEILFTAEKTNAQLNEITMEILKNHALPTTDLRFTTEMVQGAMRMRGRLDWEIKSRYSGNYQGMEPELKTILRLGLYQLRFMDSVPDYAAVSTMVKLAKKINPRYSGITNGILRNAVRHPPAEPDYNGHLGELAERLSHPRWLVEKWQKQWGRDATLKLIQWNNRRPVVWFRRNPFLISSEMLETQLASWKIVPDYFDDDSLYFTVDRPGVLLNSQLLSNGALTVQNPASGLIVRMLDIQPGQKIIDGCAAPGGKTTLIAQLTGETGKVYAYDNSHTRFLRLQQNLQIFGMKNIDAQLRRTDADELPEADKILLDVPCTGTGAICKRADIRWRRSLGDIREMNAIQRRLLENAAKYLTPGGTIVYATCSLEPEENRTVVDNFLQHHPEFALSPGTGLVPDEYLDQDGALNTFPSVHNIDGGFAVRLVKND